MFFTRIYIRLKNIWEHLLHPSKYYSKKYAKQYAKKYSIGLYLNKDIQSHSCSFSSSSFGSV